MSLSEDDLRDFVERHGFAKTRGALNVGLVISRRAGELGLPLDAESLLSPSGGQVAGLNGEAGNRILRDHGVTRSIGTEVGRTNRGSIANMRAYVAFLNDQHAQAPVDLKMVERFWVDLFKARFASAPFKLRRDAGLAIEFVIRDLLNQAEERQREAGGAMIVGTVLQHLTGAKLAVALEGRATIDHHSANQNDSGRNRGGDFDIGDAAIHVTGTPSEALLRKCQDNLDAAIRPIIVTTVRGAQLADLLAGQIGIRERVEVIEIGQFVSTNVQELGLFAGRDVTTALDRIIKEYNRIVELHEVDLSLRIVTGRKS